MDKRPNQVTKTLKEDILRGNQLSSPSSTDNSEPSTSSSTNNSVIRSSDTYIYGVVSILLFIECTCVFFACSKRSSLTSNKEQVNK